MSVQHANQKHINNLWRDLWRDSLLKCLAAKHTMSGTLLEHVFLYFNWKIPIIIFYFKHPN